MIFHWILLVVSILFLWLSVIMSNEYRKLDDELEYGNPRKVRYDDYMLASLYTFLGLPAGFCMTIACIYLLVIDYLC